MRTIGKNYDAALRDINNPASSYYVADATDGMACEMLQQGFDKLNQQITDWANIITNLKFSPLSGDKKSAENISKIMDIQAAKLTRYTTLLEKCSDTTYEGNDNGNGNGNTNNTPAPGKSSMLPILGVGALLLFLFMKKSKR